MEIFWSAFFIGLQLIRVVSKRNASFFSLSWTLNLCIVFVRSQSRIDAVENFTFNSFLWVVIDRFPPSVRYRISSRMSSKIFRFVKAYFPVSGYNGWLCVSSRVVRVILHEFLGQLTLACQLHPWRFDLVLWWLRTVTFFWFVLATKFAPKSMLFNAAIWVSF